MHSVHFDWAFIFIDIPTPEKLLLILLNLSSVVASKDI